jgi:quercetin dioxygenase-like cupin family protein
MNVRVVHTGEGPAFWVVGDRYTILTSGDETGGTHALIHAEVPPRGGPPPHVHRREDEAFYVLEGELVFHADGRDISATAGTWITLPKGSRHYFKNVGPAPAKMLILVSPAGLEKFFEEIGTPATDPSATPPPPDIPRLLAVAPRYGIEIVAADSPVSPDQDR